MSGAANSSRGVGSSVVSAGAFGRASVSGRLFSNTRLSSESASSPRIARRNLTQSQTDPFCLDIETQNHHVDRLADLQQLGRMPDAIP